MNKDRERFKELLNKDISVIKQIILFKNLFGLSRVTFFRWKYNLKHNRPLNMAKHSYYKEKHIFELCYFCDNQNNLHTHHIDGNHNNDNKNNLVVLCASCHKKLHLLILNKL